MVLTRELGHFSVCVNMLEPFKGSVLDVSREDELIVHQENSCSGDGSNRKFAVKAVS